MSKEQQRKELATRVVETLEEKIGRTMLGVAVHWDDCDCDCRSFWVHVTYPGLYGASPSTFEARSVSMATRSAWAATKKQLEGPSPYLFQWEKLESPRALYRKYPRERREFTGYSQIHWVYKLTFNGF